MGRRKRLYEINERGRRTLAEWLASSELAEPELRDEGLLKLFFGAPPKPIFEQSGAYEQALADLPEPDAEPGTRT